jgi:hypothetical protein
MADPVVHDLVTSLSLVLALIILESSSLLSLSSSSSLLILKSFSEF